MDITYRLIFWLGVATRLGGVDRSRWVTGVGVGKIEDESGRAFYLCLQSMYDAWRVRSIYEGFMNVTLRFSSCCSMISWLKFVIEGRR